jgi:TPP-dependent pyruvate/acetoin dehydrogenase alpha subunit
MASNKNRDADSSKQQRGHTTNNKNNQASPMSAARLKRLYSSMLQSRMTNALLRKNGADAAHGTGLEAIIAGPAVHLNANDLIAPSPYRALARLVQGTPLTDIFAECTTKPGKSASKDGSTAIGEQLHLAAGMALACKLMKKDSVVLCLAISDEEPDCWWNALRFSAGQKLPVVFVLAHEIEKQPRDAGDLRLRAQKLAPAITVDGNDVVAVSRVAEESTRRARQGLGPSLIECLLDSRHDPLLFMENYLKQRTLWSDSWKQGLVRRFSHDLTAAKFHQYPG